MSICPYLKGAEEAMVPYPEIVKQINDQSTIMTSGPQQVLHDVDSGCNLQCPMCRPEKILINKDNVEIAMKELDEIISVGRLERFHTSSYGEPLLFKPFVERLESDYFSSRGIMLGMTTNLTYFKQELFEKIKHNHWIRISVSADGCSKETYEKIRVGAKWDVFERNLHNLKAYRVEGYIDKLIWNWVVMRPNIHEIDKAILLAKEIGFDEMVFILQRGPVYGNIFEDCDLETIDLVREKIESVDGFNSPIVNLTSLHCLRDGSYRTLYFMISMARFVFSETGQQDIKSAQIRVLRALSLCLRQEITLGAPLLAEDIIFLNKISMYDEVKTVQGMFTAD